MLAFHEIDLGASLVCRVGAAPEIARSLHRPPPATKPRPASPRDRADVQDLVGARFGRMRRRLWIGRRRSFF